MWKIPVALLVVGALAVGLYLFQPWRLFTSSTVDETAPVSQAEPTDVAASATPAPDPSPADPSPADPSPAGPSPAGPTPTEDSPVNPSGESSAATPAPAGQTETEAPRDRTLATGAFEDAEHATSGEVTVLRLADGRRYVRLESLATSDGPDLHVWLSDQPSGGDWGSYDDGRYLKLGELKANRGNQNYLIPAGAKLAGMRSVVVWCDRFNVAFGTAPVQLRS